MSGLLDVSQNIALEELPARVRECAAHAGLRNVRIYLADLQQRVLRRVTGEGLTAAEGPGAEELPVDGSAAGRAFQQLRNVPVPGGAAGEAAGGAPGDPVPVGHGDRRCWVPLVHGTERLGVLRMDARLTDHDTVQAMGHLAALTALLVAGRAAESDSYFRMVRSRPMNVAAEMQWRLMPPLTFANDAVTIAAAFEPAYEIAGDAFDYALAGDTAHLAVFDAMGHDVAAGLTANLAVAACRNSRRQRTALAHVGEAVERALLEQDFKRVRYLTALIADLDMRTGVLSWTNHGHHPPAIIRNNRISGLLECPPSHPLGTALDLPVTVCTEQLRHGDRVVLYTDGIVEARHPEDDSEFGLDQLLRFLIHHSAEGLPVPEILRRLTHSVMAYHQGRLHDDATILLLEWRGPVA